MKNLTCKFTLEQTHALDNLAVKTKQSYAEVISQALKLYNEIIDDVQLGNQVLIAKDGIPIKEVIGIIK